MSPLKSWSERRKEADAEGAKFAPLQPDTYSFVVPEAAKIEEKDGNPRFKINPAVEAGPRAKARVFHTFYISDKPSGMRFFFEQMDALGLGHLFDGEPTNEQIAAALQGRRFTAEVYNDEWDGKVYQKLRKFAPPIGSAPAAGPGGGGFAPSAGPAPAAQSFGQAPVQQQAPAPQQYAQPVQQQAAQPVQQFAQQPVQQAAPVQQAQAPQQYAQPVQQAPVAAQQPAAESPWTTPQTTELAPPPFLQ